MGQGTTRPRDVIAAGASRLSNFSKQLQLAHDDHGITPGLHDDLAGFVFRDACEPIYRATLGEAYLERLGLTFGAVEVLMGVFSHRLVPAAEHPRWQLVQQYFGNTANLYAPEYRNRLDELPSLELAEQATPAIVRFDLLAGLASSSGTMRLFDAASWVTEISPTLPELDDVDLDPLALAALAVSIG